MAIERMKLGDQSLQFTLYDSSWRGTPGGESGRGIAGLEEIGNVIGGRDCKARGFGSVHPVVSSVA